MSWSRRSLLKASAFGLAGAGFVGSTLVGSGLFYSGRPPFSRVGFAGVSERFFSAHKDQGKHFVSAMNVDGIELFKTATPTASHSIASYPVSAGFPKGIIIAISRDPDEPALVLDAESGAISARLPPKAGRHFNGHGVFSPDGKLFYATQNDFEAQRGVIAVYDLQQVKQLGEFASGGQGPHELLLLSDGLTLAIANGGVQTHPDSGRKGLNLDSMQPSLAYVDRISGKLLQVHDLPDKQLSIRHLSRASDDTIGIALQYKGQKNEPPVVGFQRGEQAIRLAKAPGKLHWMMNQYTGSICIHPQTGLAAISCPRGNMLTFWDSRTATFLSAIDIHDVGGLALSDDGEAFLATGGTGKLYRINIATLGLAEQRLPEWPKAHWGNHLTALGLAAEQV